MVDTIRTKDDLLELIVTNVAGNITAQDIRDVLVSALPTGRTATKVIMASDADPQWLAQADFVCDGVADDVEILLAIATGARRILFSEGTFNLAGSSFHNLLVNQSNLVLEGQGLGITTLKATVANRHMIGNTTLGLSNLTIKNMTLDHNAQNLGSNPGVDGWHLIRLEEFSKVTLENVELANSDHHGIATLPETSNPVNADYFLDKIYARNMGCGGHIGGDAIRIHYGSDGLTVSNVIVDGVELHGIHVGLGQQTISNIIVRNSGLAAFEIQSDGATCSNLSAEWNFTSDVIANRPAAGNPGALFWASDESKVYKDNGVVWHDATAADALKGLHIVRRNTNFPNTRRIGIDNLKLVMNVTETTEFVAPGDGISTQGGVDDVADVAISNFFIKGRFRLGGLITRQGFHFSTGVVEGVRNQGFQLGANTGTHTGFSIIGVDFIDVVSSGGASLDAVFLHNSCHSARIIGCGFYGSNHRYGVSENTSADENIVVGNHLSGTTAGALKSGVNSVFANNIGTVV